MATASLPSAPGVSITDPTGGAPNFNILQVFQSFGYTPTQAEIDAIAPSFEGRYDIAQTGTSAVAQYVNHKNAEVERQKNDPLVALQTKMEESVTQMKSQVTGLHQQLQDTLSAAPELFGSLTPDQISTYLAPLKTAFKAQLAQVQSVMGSRGLAASSTENNALAQTDEQFKEQVFSTGLNVGLTAQQQKAKALQDQINNLFGLTGTEEGIASGAAQTRSQQNLGQSNLIASLPFFLDQASALRNEAATATANQGGFWDTFNKVTSGINQGVNTFQNLMMVPSQFQANPRSSAPNTPANPMGQVPNIPAFGPQTPMGPSLPGGVPSSEAALFS